MKEEKKRYWLKLDKNFMKSTQINIIKNMPNGKDYVIFYLSLMLESIETIGHLRITPLIPYNPETLAAATNTNIDIVRNAIKIFCELGMMQIFDDGTIFLPCVADMTGKECESAERVRNYRENKQKALQCNTDVTKSNDNKDKQRIITENKEDKQVNKKTQDTSQENESLLSLAYNSFFEMRNKLKKPLTTKAKEILQKKLDSLADNDEDKIKILNQSILNCWLSVFPLTTINQPYSRQQKENFKNYSETPKDFRVQPKLVKFYDGENPLEEVTADYIKQCKIDAGLINE